MTIKNKLNSAWSTNKNMDGVFEFRAEAENAYNVIQETVSRIDEVIAKIDVNQIDDEIIQQGGAIKSILNSAKTELDKHKEFIEWRQPK